MRITLAPLISSARGKLGNVVFSIAASGQPYVRQVAAIASNPRSFWQQGLRCLMSWLAHEWHDTLDAPAKASWEEFAKKTVGIRVDINQGGGKYNLIPRSRGYMSGYNAYIAINQRLFNCLRTQEDYTNIPPVGPPPYQVQDLVVIYEPIDNTIDLTWVDGDLSTDFEQPVLRMWIESYEGGCHKQLVACVSVTAETYSIENARYALGILGPIVNHPGLYRIQCDVLEATATGISTGLVSPPSRIFEVIVL